MIDCQNSLDIQHSLCLRYETPKARHTTTHSTQTQMLTHLNNAYLIQVIATNTDTRAK